jgi:hypothetical protein
MVIELFAELVLKPKNQSIEQYLFIPLNHSLNLVKTYDINCLIVLNSLEKKKYPDFISLLACSSLGWQPIGYSKSKQACRKD